MADLKHAILLLLNYAIYCSLLDTNSNNLEMLGLRSLRHCSRISSSRVDYQLVGYCTGCFGYDCLLARSCLGTRRTPWCGLPGCWTFVRGYLASPAIVRSSIGRAMVPLGWKPYFLFLAGLCRSSETEVPLRGSSFYHSRAPQPLWFDHVMKADGLYCSYLLNAATTATSLHPSSRRKPPAIMAHETRNFSMPPDDLVCCLRCSCCLLWLIRCWAWSARSATLSINHWSHVSWRTTSPALLGCRLLWWLYFHFAHFQSQLWWWVILCSSFDAGQTLPWTAQSDTAASQSASLGRILAAELERWQTKSSRQTDLQVMVYRHRWSDLFHSSPFSGRRTFEVYCSQTLASPRTVCRSASMHRIGIGIFQLSYAINFPASQAPQKIILDSICCQLDQMSPLVVPAVDFFVCLWFDHKFESSIIDYIWTQHTFSDLQTSWQNLFNSHAAHACNNSNSCFPT